MRNGMLLLLVFSLQFTFVQPLRADSSEATAAERVHDAETVINFSKKIEKLLAKKGARVAIVGRVGRQRDELPEGMRFTHVGFAVYSQIVTEDGRRVPGYAMYNLYQDSEHQDRSKLVQDYPADFFAGVKMLEAGVIILTPELQKRLLPIFNSQRYSDLHNPHYSAIANPFTMRLQNCTEFVLDVLFAAIYGTDDINQIKANEKAYFEPQRVNVNLLKLAFGSMFISDVAIADHPEHPVTATYTTIERFLEKFNASSESLLVTPDSEHEDQRMTSL